MQNITILFPNGTKKEFNKGITPLEIASSISEGLARAAVAAYINNDEFQNAVVDLTIPLESDTELRILTFKDKEGIDVFRHSTAHLLAHAATELYPKAKPTIGPVVEEGFYYDFDSDPFSPEDLEKIEKKMDEIVGQKLPVERIELKRDEALRLFRENPYKTEMIKEMPPDGKITAYRQGKFVDLCRGPHIPNTKMLKAFKLTKIAGAYWRGDSKNKQLQRIYGISFPDKKDLAQYLMVIEEARKRDHRKIGKDLDLFSFHDEGPGFPFFHPKGTIIYNELIDFMREENRKRGYSEIKTPIILNKQLWVTSGHWDKFRENMYFTHIDGQEYAVKPMNCPGGLLIYKSRLHSYRELPIRNAEYGYVHRHELSGVLHGLFRVRAFTQDDAHSFCAEDQIEAEIIHMVDYAVHVYSKFGFNETAVYVATKPEKYIGEDAAWKKATEALANALRKKKIDFRIKKGEGAFYGPKIEFDIKDCLGREWQCGTIQVDFSMPARFEAVYEGQDGRKHTPVMIHRAILGSIERFLGIVIENCAGKFPLWLNPNQAIVLTVADRHEKYGDEIFHKLRDAGVRVEKDFKSETIPKKVREAQLRQFNYIFVVGDKEAENKTVAVRTRDNVVHGEKDFGKFLGEVLDEIRERR